MRKYPKLDVRMPQEVKEALERAAAADSRSMGNLAVVILQRWLTEKGFLKEVRVTKHQRRP